MYSQTYTTTSDFIPINKELLSHSTDADKYTEKFSSILYCSILRIDEVNTDQSGSINMPNSNIFNLMLATERVLSRDWDTPDEDEAWAHL